MSMANPFSDIGARVQWHRKLIGMTQVEYAEKLGVKRPNLALWETGVNRVGLDSAIKMRQLWGVSLDFVYEGIDDALPMTLRQQWHDRQDAQSDD